MEIKVNDLVYCKIITCTIDERNNAYAIDGGLINCLTYYKYFGEGLHFFSSLILIFI